MLRALLAQHDPRWLLGALIVLCVAVYAPGLGGGFLFDDIPNIVDNPALGTLSGPTPDWFAAALLSGSGALRRPVSMLSFGLNVRTFGMDAFAFKAVNLAIHLLSGLLLYAFARRVAPRLLPAGTSQRTGDYVALACVAWWLLHPLHVSTVLYVVQRMTELSALFTLAGLLCYVEGRQKALNGEGGLTAGILGLSLFGLLAVFSKENGALIVLLALVTEWLCFRFAGSPATRRSLQAFFLFFAVLPALAGLAYLLTHGNILAHERNGFTFYTHLLSDARVLCAYLAWIVLPLPSWLGMFHDDIPVSTSLLSPASTLLSIVFLLALSAVAWRARRRCPGITFAIGWFLLAQSMEQGIIPLELVFEHRNYLPSTGLLLGVCCAATPLLRHLSRGALATAGAVALLALSGATFARATAWGNPLSLALTDARHHPESSRSQYQAGREIMLAGARNDQVESTAREAAPYFDRATALNPLDVYSAAARIMIRPATQPIPAHWINDLARRLAHAQSGEQINPFFDLLISASRKEIALSPQDASSLFEAAMANQRWRSSARAMLMNNYGTYLFNVTDDRQGAIALTMAAAEADPTNPYFLLNLAKIAVAVGDHDRAAVYLDRAGQLDNAHIYRAAIDKTMRELKARTLAQ